MAIIQAQKKAASGTPILVISTKWKNQIEYGFTKEEVGYLDGFFKDESKKQANFNSSGRIIAVLVTDPKKETHMMMELCRKVGGVLADTINAAKGKELNIYNSTKQTAYAYTCAEGAALANYQFIKYVSGAKDKKNSLEKISLIGAGYDAKVLNKLNIVVEATTKARDLVNEPVNHLNATDLANAFKQMGKQAGFKVDVYNKKKIEELKMGGLLSVNAGSVDEPTFTVMEYKPRAKNKKPFVIVGKGVTYDTGGLSLKPTPNSMDLMKCDMAGGAAVGAAMYAIAKARLNVHVIALVPATDNRPGFNAFAPGDIITMMDGTTVEMVNSDAEGRMILADALHFAKRYKPELAIDIATLTGAAMAAIGTNAMVGMGNAPKKYSDKIKQSGDRVFERVAEFPFWEDYSEMMKSDIADQRNLGGGYAGAIQGGKFLEKYTDYPYYHLDIAGPAFLTAKDGYRGKGGTGIGVRLFFDFFNSL
jgi:leucyl aminopeptidase